MRKTALSIIATAASVAAVTPAIADAPVKPKRSSILLHGFPEGGDSQRHGDITLNFFLTRKVLGRDVTATVAGRRAKVKHVGADSTFYVGSLAPSVRLRWDRYYTVKITIKRHGTYTYRIKLPRQRL